MKYAELVRVAVEIVRTFFFHLRYRATLSWNLFGNFSAFTGKLNPFVFQQCYWDCAMGLLPQYCLLISSPLDRSRNASVFMEIVLPQTSNNQPDVDVMRQSESDRVCKYVERNCSSLNAVDQSPSMLHVSCIILLMSTACTSRGHQYQHRQEWADGLGWSTT